MNPQQADPLLVDIAETLEVPSERVRELEEMLELFQLPEANNIAWYQLALTHGSYPYEFKRSSLESYERLEFLGDAVLKLAISETLFRRFPDYREGDLTKIRAVVVSDATLAKIAEDMQLGTFMLFGPNEARSGGCRKSSNLACAFEAFLGALFMDGHLEAAMALVNDMLGEAITNTDLSKTKDNYKAVLQEFTQGAGDGLPVYRTISERGPAHRKTFEVEVRVNDEVVGLGVGKTKKEAQQQAAKVALDTLAILDSQ